MTLHTMLNVFPILFLSLLAHALLRIFVGGTLLYLGFQHITQDRTDLRDFLATQRPRTGTVFFMMLVLLEWVCGAMFIFGALTQIAALATMLLSLMMLMLAQTLSHPAIPNRLYYVMLLGASLSLFITGAGALAVDVPL